MPKCEDNDTSRWKGLQYILSTFKASTLKANYLTNMGQVPMQLANVVTVEANV